MHLNGHDSSKMSQWKTLDIHQSRKKNQGTWSHTDLDLGLDMM